MEGWSIGRGFKGGPFQGRVVLKEGDQPASGRNGIPERSAGPCGSGSRLGGGTRWAVLVERSRCVAVSVEGRRRTCGSALGGVVPVKQGGRLIV